MKKQYHIKNEISKKAVRGQGKNVIPLELMIDFTNVRYAVIN